MARLDTSVDAGASLGASLRELAPVVKQIPQRRRSTEHKRSESDAWHRASPFAQRGACSIHA